MGLLGNLGKGISTEVGKQFGVEPKAEPDFETMTLKIDEAGFMGRTTGDQKKLAKLLADGWEIVGSTGYGRKLYTLRRPRQ